MSSPAAPSHLNEVGPLLDQILHAQAQTNAALSPQSLEAVAKRMVAVADALDVRALHGGSTAGEMIVGAMVLLSGRLLAWTGEDEDVLLVDGVIVTPLGTRTAAAQIRKLGARAVHGAVVDVLQPETLESSQEPFASFTVLSSG